MFLHAYSYQGPDWHYETPSFPKWITAFAIEDAVLRQSLEMPQTQQSDLDPDATGANKATTGTAESTSV